MSKKAKKADLEAENKFLKEQLAKANKNIDKLLIFQGEQTHPSPSSSDTLAGPSTQSAPPAVKYSDTPPPPVSPTQQQQPPGFFAEYPPDTPPLPMGKVDMRKAHLYHAHTAEGDWKSLDSQQKVAAFAYSKDFKKKLAEVDDDELNKE